MIGKIGALCFVGLTGIGISYSLINNPRQQGVINESAVISIEVTLGGKHFLLPKSDIVRIWMASPENAVEIPGEYPGGWGMTPERLAMTRDIPGNINFPSYVQALVLDGPDRQPVTSYLNKVYGERVKATLCGLTERADVPIWQLYIPAKQDSNKTTVTCFGRNGGGTDTCLMNFAVDATVGARVQFHHSRLCAWDAIRGSVIFLLSQARIK